MRTMTMTTRGCAAFLFAAMVLGSAAWGPAFPSTPALATQQQEEKFDFDIPPQPLAAAIPSFMHVTEIKVVFTPDLVDNKRTTGVFGTFSVEEGLQVLLDGTGLSYTFNDPKTVTLRVDAE